MEKENVVIKQRCHSKPRPLPLSRAPWGCSTGASYSDLESYLIKINDEIPYQVRDDSRGVRDDGMRCNGGFTLIELLVVVLIIGILAAVAVPQYQKAVEKSRATEAIQLMKTVNQAVDTYHMSSGEWPTSFDELAVDIPWTGRKKGYIDDAIKDVRSNGKWSIQLENRSCQSIIATRLDGKYEGAAFLIEKACAATPWNLDELYCDEFLRGNKSVHT